MKYRVDTHRKGRPPMQMEVATTPCLHGALMRLLRPDLPDVQRRYDTVRQLHYGGMVCLHDGDVAVTVLDGAPDGRAVPAGRRTASLLPD